MCRSLQIPGGTKLGIHQTDGQPAAGTVELSVVVKDINAFHKKLVEDKEVKVVHGPEKARVAGLSSSSAG